MVDALEPLLDAGRIKLYCVDSYDSQSWQAHDVPLEERARRHGFYEWWILERVVPWISADSGGAGELVVTGVSFGAYHAANFALKRADLFPLAICMSGVYDVSVVGWGERGDAVYFNNPLDYVGGMADPGLIESVSSANLHIATGTGPWEHPAHSYDLSRALSFKGIRHSLDDWGPLGGHDWPYWKHQMDVYISRLF